MNKVFFAKASFLAGFSLMTVELAAARILAPYVGASVYTWTSVIGTVLLGYSIGSYLGGYWIDKYRSRRLIFYFFIAAAFLVAVIPLLSLLSPFLVRANISIAAITVILSAVLFLAPSFCFGAIYPALLKIYSHDSVDIGKNSGFLSAWWSIGSIAGTFLTGFYFIGFIGTIATVLIISVILFLTGLFFYRPPTLKLLGLIFLFIILLAAIFGIKKIFHSNNVIFSRESDYYKISVIDDRSGRLGSAARLLFLDADMHSAESFDGSYLNIYLEISPVFSVFNSGIKNILAIGGGSYDMPKLMSGFYKNSDITAVEIDPAVEETAREFFGLNNFSFKTAVGDGRIFLQKNQQKHDLIFTDAFNSFLSVPWHLTTYEFNELVKSRLADNGIYAVNIISSFEGKNSGLFKSFYATFSKTFPNNYIFAYGSNDFMPQNIILVGVNSKQKIVNKDLTLKIRELENGEFLASLLKPNPAVDKNSVILTDDFAPVANLMRPLVNAYFKADTSLYYSLLFGS